MIFTVYKNRRSLCAIFGVVSRDDIEQPVDIEGLDVLGVSAEDSGCDLRISCKI